MMTRMKSGFFIALALMALFVPGLQGEVIFLHDGNAVTSTILDLSSRTGNFDLQNGMTIHRSRIWMINFENGDWDFPGERSQLANNADTLILNNGQVLYANITDFSSRFRRFEFANGGKVTPDQVRRIYLCCQALPPAYSNNRGGGGWNTNPGRRSNYNGITYMVDGRMITSPLKYLNSEKTGFQDGLQVNTKDLWLINFEGDQYYFPNELGQLDKAKDTVFMKNGEMFTDTVSNFDANKNTFQFENGDPIHFTDIQRIYFCCNQFPDALKRKGGGIGRFAK